MASGDIFTECVSEEEVHNKLMTTFCCDYFGSELWKGKFEKFKLSSFLYLTNPVERTVTTTHDIWEELERKGFLGIQNYKILKKLVKEIDDELTDLIEDAEDKISILRGEDVQKREKRPYFEDRDKRLTEFKENLYKMNYNETQRIPVSPLQKTSRLAMEKIFASVCIREDLEYRGTGRNIGTQERRSKPIKSPDDMFYIDGKLAKNIFMLGDAAIGKTVFCLRLVENWCNAKRSNHEVSNIWVKALGEFDFLFLIQLRHVDKSRISVIDMICHDVFLGHPECHDVIRHVLSSGKYRCLIAVDGLDEWKITDDASQNLRVEGLPNIDNIAYCTFLWSTRPWAMDRFSDSIRGNDRVVEILGLDTSSINTVIENMLVNFYELEKGSLQYKAKFKELKVKSQDPKLKSITQIPLMAIACIQVWYQEMDVGRSMTSLYVALLDLLAKRTIQKSPSSKDLAEKVSEENLSITHIPQIFAQSQRVKEIISLIMKLGKIAYEDLISNEMHLVFRVEDLENSLEDYELQYSLRAGFLSKCEAPGSCNEENVSVNFFHKSIQEFLAAVYIENNGIISELHKHLKSVKVIYELGNVLIFLSGLNPILGSIISQHIVKVANDDAEICRYRKLSNQNKMIELLYKLQVSCFREMHNSTSTGQMNVVPYHVSDVYLLDDSDIETIRTTTDILTHHNANIKSIRISKLFSDNNIGIPTSVFTQCLDHCVSLQSLRISGFGTRMTLSKISNRFSSLTTILLYSITLTPETIGTLQIALTSNSVIQTLGLVDITCEANKGQIHEPAPLSGLIKIIPDLRSLSALNISVANKVDRPVLRDVLCHLSYLHCIAYYCTFPRDGAHDCDVVQTLCTWSELRTLYLYDIHLGDKGLRLSSKMIHMEEVYLRKVVMSAAAWTDFVRSVIDLQHTFEIKLVKVNIDQDSLRTIQSYAFFRITENYVDYYGGRTLYFTKVPSISSQGQK